MYSKFGQFIDGKWQQSSTNERYDVLNPATEEVVGKESSEGSERRFKVISGGSGIE